MNSRIVEALEFVHTYASHVDSWIVIKKELLKALPAEDRSLFSTRHPLTKKQSTNEFEQRVIEHWSALTGRPVVFSQ